jgi:serine/threonine protein kinase
VNDYKIGKLLGTGAYGQVFRATKVFEVYAIKARAAE